MLLANVLFLTSVWQYSTLRAGLAITAGPARGRRAVGPDGQARRAASGTGRCSSSAASCSPPAVGWYATVVGTEPHYLAQWLPAALLVGLGVAFGFPVLSAAAVAGLPTDRFAAGGAINQTARQLGAVLGVAVLVAIIGTPGSADEALPSFHNAWIMCAVASVMSAAISLCSGRPAPRYRLTNRAGTRWRFPPRVLN